MRILLIEDEAKLSSFVSRGLAMERFSVDTARDGRSGIEVSQSNHYDLIILDLMLPKISGG
jgi:two-component system copper resistance phosphate regulon response regulator CusR